MGKGVNYSGAFNRKDTPLQQLPEKPVALNAKFFREIVRRIETIVPVESKDGLIKVTPPKDRSSPGLEITGEIIKLNACIDGSPGTISVIGKIDGT